MTVLVFALPYIPPPPKVSPWTHNIHTWTAWDGSVWDMCQGTRGAVLQAGVRGTFAPPITHYTTASPAVHGSQWRGWLAGERDVFWPVKVFHDGGSAPWIDLNRRFWRTLRPDRPGTWTVTLPDGTSRSLSMRFSDDSQAALDIAPEMYGWYQYQFNFKAVDPFWAGQPITRDFVGPEQRLLFGGGAVGSTELAPAFGISRGSSFASATIPNPGDLDAWPVWTINGPFTAATVGVGSQTITISTTLTAGQSITLDTDPRVQQAIRENGTDVTTTALTSANYAPVPDGAEVPLNVTLTGAGTIRATLVPRYLTAY